MLPRPKPVVLAILDGWGCAESSADNAIALAATPNWEALSAAYPMTKINASELHVGLPHGQMGNSEVGHMNIGSGRVVMQDLPRIDAAIADGSLAANPKLQAFIARLKETGGACHLLGLLSDGGVHAHQHHMAALANIVAASGVPVWVHAFTDGRDTPPQSALGYVEAFERECGMFSSMPGETFPVPPLARGGRGETAVAPSSGLNSQRDSPPPPPASGGTGENGVLNKDTKEAAKLYSLIRFATISGRYYAMDRDQRWDRVKRAYDVLVTGHGQPAATLSISPAAQDAVLSEYSAGRQDEFIHPTSIDGWGSDNFYEGMQDGDGLLMANFRADRAREILAALLDPAFDGFARAKTVRFAEALGMVEYSEKLNPFIGTIFPPEKLEGLLGEVASNAGLTQLRIAETEKYAHVTFFFNGGREEPYAGEQRILIPSPKVATYDMKPEMSAPEITDALVNVIHQGKYDLIVVNYANTDMVGHTGNVDAAKRAVETVDACIGRVSEAVIAAGGAMLITADHGNAESLFDHDTNQPHTAHTLNLVPALLVGDAFKGRAFAEHEGRLADIAPTLLALLQLPQPDAMTGESLLRYLS